MMEELWVLIPGIKREFKDENQSDAEQELTIRNLIFEKVAAVMDPFDNNKHKHGFKDLTKQYRDGYGKEVEIYDFSKIKTSAESSYWSEKDIFKGWAPVPRNFEYIGDSQDFGPFSELNQSSEQLARKKTKYSDLYPSLKLYAENEYRIGNTALVTKGDRHGIAYNENGKWFNWRLRSQMGLPFTFLESRYNGFGRMYATSTNSYDFNWESVLKRYDLFLTGLYGHLKNLIPSNNSDDRWDYMKANQLEPVINVLDYVIHKDRDKLRSFEEFKETFPYVPKALLTPDGWMDIFDELDDDKTKNNPINWIYSVTEEQTKSWAKKVYPIMEKVKEKFPDHILISLKCAIKNKIYHDLNLTY